MANRYLRATGNWNGPVWAATSGGAAGSASTPTADDYVYIYEDFSVTLTADAICTAFEQQSGGIYLGSHTLTVINGSFRSIGAEPRTIGLGSGTLLLDMQWTISRFILSGANLNFNAGTSRVIFDNCIGNRTTDTLGKTFNDVYFNLGIRSSAAYLNITGSPTFRTLDIRNANSQAHTVGISDGSYIKVGKLILLGHNSSNKLTLYNSDHGEDWLTGFWVSDGGSVYGQNLNIDDISLIDSVGDFYTESTRNFRPYVGLDSTSSSTVILQDPPKVSTLIDDFTEMSDDSEIDINWSKEVSGLGDIFLSGSSGVIVFAFGTNGVSRLISKDTYDVTSDYIYVRGLQGQSGRVGIFVPYQDSPLGPWPPIDGSHDYRVKFTGTSVIVEILMGGSWVLDEEHSVPTAYRDPSLWSSVRVGARVSTSNPAQSLSIQSIGIGEGPASSGNFLAFFTP